MSADEQWRPTHIRGDRYEVSDLGRVRSSWRGGHVLKAWPNPHGYPMVKVFYDGKQRNVYVHHLVAHAFLEGAGEQIRHRDGDPANNQATNLAYGTRAENMQDAIEHGTNAKTRLTHCLRGHPLSEARVQGRWRICRPCERARGRAYRARKAGKA